MSTDRSITLLGIGLGGVISISSASGHYDFIDMAAGIILIAILFPTIKSNKAGKLERFIVSIIAALTTVLVLGVFIDYGIYRLHGCPLEFLARNNPQSNIKESLTMLQNTQVIHFSLWLFSSAVFYVICLWQENLTRLSKIAQ